MPAELKIQIFFAGFLVLVLLGAYMVIIRSLAALGYSLARMEAILARELALAAADADQARKKAEQAGQAEKDRGLRNDLLINIPLMEKLGREKKA